MKKLFYLLALATIISCSGDEDSTVPELSTVAVSNITQTTAQSGGAITSNGGAEISSRGIVWSTQQNPTISLTTKTTDGSGDGTFTSSIANLTPETTYFVRAYATNSVGTAYGNEVSFSTGDILLPEITTTEITDITSSTATSGGNIISNGGGEITERGVVWSTAQNPTINLETKTVDGSGIGDYISNISNLLPATLYYVRAYATNSAGTSYGNEITFSTYDLPSVETLQITSISYNSFLTGGNVITGGGSDVINRGVVWDVNSNPTIELDTKTENGTGLGLFQSEITNLIPETSYYLRSYATNPYGTSYGNQIEFQTGLEIFPETADVTEITATNAYSGNTNIPYNGFADEVGIIWSNNQNINLTNYLGKRSYEFGGAARSQIRMYKIDDLTPNTTYYVRSFCTVNGFTGYGDVKEFTTLDYFPLQDIDGNTYETVKYERDVYNTTAYWDDVNVEISAENLRVKHYKNGDIIPQAQTQQEWLDAYYAEQGAWCYYNNVENDEHGLIYNGYAVADPRGLAPEGWHIPTYDELEHMILYMVSGNLGSYDSSRWISTEYGGDYNNQNLMNCNLSGSRYFDAPNTTFPFQNQGNEDVFWTSTTRYGEPISLFNDDQVEVLKIPNGSPLYFYDLHRKRSGFRVRVIKD